LSEADMKTLFAAMLWASATAASAQTIHKCTHDGKVSYSDTPCPAGASSAILDTPVAPPANPAAAAALRSQRKEAGALANARRQREEREARDDARAAQAAAQQRRKCDKLQLQKRWADDDARRAAGQASEAARLRAQRAGEAMALECKH
jgi:type IV secretory pathway VirB10-like protein